jgi:hypothetical protein
VVSADVTRDASNALVASAEAARLTAAAYARMLAESEQEKQRLAEGLVKSEAAYAGLLAEKEASCQNQVRLEAVIRHLEARLVACGRVAVRSLEPTYVKREDPEWSPAFEDVASLRREHQAQMLLLVRFAELEVDAKELLDSPVESPGLTKIRGRMRETLRVIEKLREPPAL